MVRPRARPTSSSHRANAAKNLGLTVIPAKDLAERFPMVDTDRAVAFFNDDIVLSSLVAGEGSGALRDLDRRDLEARALRHHVRKDDVPFKKVAERPPGILQQPGIPEDLREVVHEKIPPKGMNLNMPIRERDHKKGVRQPDRQLEDQRRLLRPIKTVGAAQAQRGG